MRTDGKSGAGIPPETEREPKKGRGRPKKEVTKTKTIHNIFVLDKSTSMVGTRIIAAVSGLEENLKSIKQDISGAIQLTSFIEFNKDVTPIYVRQNIETLSTKIGVRVGGSTALYDAIMEAGQLAMSGTEDAKLISIFTDGEENSSKTSKESCANFIKELEVAGVTVTFIGTDFDVTKVVNQLGINRSNTVSHDNSAASIVQAMNLTAVARTAYSKSVVLGEDVSTNFYSKVLTNER